MIMVRGFHERPGHFVRWNQKLNKELCILKHHHTSGKLKDQEIFRRKWFQTLAVHNFSSQNPIRFKINTSQHGIGSRNHPESHQKAIPNSTVIWDGNTSQPSFSRLCASHLCRRTVGAYVCKEGLKRCAHWLICQDFDGFSWVRGH